MDGLEAVIKKLSMAKIECEIWVDGSFLTKKIDPFDSDILVAIQGQFYDSATLPQQIEVIRLMITD